MKAPLAAASNVNVPNRSCWDQSLCEWKKEGQGYAPHRQNGGDKAVAGSAVGYVATHDQMPAIWITHRHK
jgi:hypothetical protein